MYDKGATWVDMHQEYKASLKLIKQVKQSRKGTGIFSDVVECEVAGSMEIDLTEAVKEMKNRALQEFKAISEEDIKNPRYGLTNRQQEICLHRQKYSIAHIAEILSVEKCTVYNTYEQALNKIIRIKSKERVEIGHRGDLSDQQNQILALYNQGLKTKEIALQLGISPGTVSVQKNRIKKILTKS